MFKLGDVATHRLLLDAWVVACYQACYHAYIEVDKSAERLLTRPIYGAFKCGLIGLVQSDSLFDLR